MKNNLSDHILDEKIRNYMNCCREQAFLLDEKRVFKSTDTKRIRWRLKSAHAITAIIILLLTFALTIPSVRAAVGRLFTFIPGIGISEQEDIVIYTMNPITKNIEADSMNGNRQIQAQLDNAVYSNGNLCVSTTINGRYIDFNNDLTFYINGEQVEYSASGSWALGENGINVYHNMWIKADEPQNDSLYEVEIVGFSKRLSFTLDECSKYSDLMLIGPTDTQNNISITTTASRSENQLTVWCYPLNTTKDKIIGIGSGFPIWNKQTYIETESGFIGVYNKSGQYIMERFVCDMPDSDSLATLHIPYLTFVRDEKKKVTISIPKDYSYEECNIPIEFSLGTVIITEVKREQSEYSDTPDVLRIKFSFNNADSNTVFNSFTLSDASGTNLSNTKQFNDETGLLEFVEVSIDDNISKITFIISDLCYYLLGEYVIPLDIK